MTTDAPATVQLTHRFTASAERVFDAWLDPDTVGRWFFATPDGEMVRVEIDPRVGGSFCIVERRDGKDVEHRGEYLEIERPHRLVFTLSVEKYTPHVSKVVVEIVPSETGCELSLTQELATEAVEWADRTKDGWKDVLKALEAMLNERPKGEVTERR